MFTKPIGTQLSLLLLDTTVEQFKFNFFGVPLNPLFFLGLPPFPLLGVLSMFSNLTIWQKNLMYVTSLGAGQISVH